MRPGRRSWSRSSSVTRAAGKASAAIARDLNVRGLVGVKGGRWTRERIRTLIDNPAYIGLRRHKGETFSAIWSSIVDLELWERVRARRDFNRKVQRRAPERGLLAGLLLCGVCDKRLHNHASAERRRVYECRAGFDLGPRCLGGQIMAARAESLVSAAVLELLSMVRDPGLKERAAEMTSGWGEASIDQRRGWFASVIEEVVLLARASGNPHGKGRPMGRSLRIVWAKPWSLEVFGYPGAASVPGPGAGSIVSPKGETWAEWRRQAIAGR